MSYDPVNSNIRTVCGRVGESTYNLLVQAWNARDEGREYLIDEDGDSRSYQNTCDYGYGMNTVHRPLGAIEFCSDLTTIHSLRTSPLARVKDL